MDVSKIIFSSVFGKPAPPTLPSAPPHEMMDTADIKTKLNTHSDHKESLEEQTPDQKESNNDKEEDEETGSEYETDDEEEEEDVEEIK